MKKIIVILLVALMVLSGCVSDPVAFVPDGSIIKPTPTKKINKYSRELPGIKVELPKEEVYSEDLLLQSSITNKDIIRLTKEPGARRAFDSQLKRETDAEVSEIKYEFWKKVTAVWFSVLLMGLVAWQVSRWKQNKKIDSAVSPQKKEALPPIEGSIEKRGLHDNQDSSEF